MEPEPYDPIYDPIYDQVKEVNTWSLRRTK